MRWCAYNCFFVLACLLPGGVSAKDALPNIVMIVLDDLGSHDLGLHGTGIRTPIIDRLANEQGIYLEDYYVLPYCSPTRAALLSGMYPLRTGVHTVIHQRSTAGLPLDVETLPQMLKRSHYKTRAVGKWHVGHSSWEQTPTFRGFDSFFGMYLGQQDYFTHEIYGGVDLHRAPTPNCGEGCSSVVDESGNYSTHVLTREAIDVVRNHADEEDPLFLYLAYQAVHCPNEVPSEYTTQYQNRTDWTDQRKNYAGMLTAADEGIGNLTQALKENGLWENTLVIVTTDNGGPTTVGCVQGSSNYPKKGGKCSVWEGGTTGDGLLAGPALKKLLPKDHSRFQHLFHVVDWFPTLAEWVGVLPLNHATMDGISQVDALQGNGPKRTGLFGGYCQCRGHPSWWGPAIRHLNWKLIQGESGGPNAENKWPPGFQKIQPPGQNATSKYLLFDLSKDPSETTDLSKEHPEVLKGMIAKLKLYNKSFVYPQINDDSKCPFPGLVNTTAGPAW